MHINTHRNTPNNWKIENYLIEKHNIDILKVCKIPVPKK